jgi:hypothetical protein
LSGVALGIIEADYGRMAGLVFRNRSSRQNWKVAENVVVDWWASESGYWEKEAEELQDASNKVANIF